MTTFWWVLKDSFRQSFSLRIFCPFNVSIVVVSHSVSHIQRPLLWNKMNKLEGNCWFRTTLSRLCSGINDGSTISYHTLPLLYSVPFRESYHNSNQFQFQPLSEPRRALDLLPNWLIRSPSTHPQSTKLKLKENKICILRFLLVASSPE